MLENQGVSNQIDFYSNQDLHRPKEQRVEDIVPQHKRGKTHTVYKDTHS